MSDFEQDIARLANWMFEASRIVLFTGAGISTDSGVPDYRGPDGVWTRRDAGLPPHEKQDWSLAAPNICHQAVLELQQLHKLAYLVSQNIDNLHLASGIEFDRIAELHGNVARVRCIQCEMTFAKIVGLNQCSECGGELKSSVVGFGDSLPAEDLRKSFAYAEACDLMIVLGSSLVVTPAALVPQVAKQSGARLVIINQGETPLDLMADLRLDAGLADTFVPAVAQLKLLLNNE